MHAKLQRDRLVDIMEKSPRLRLTAIPVFGGETPRHLRRSTVKIDYCRSFVLATQGSGARVGMDRSQGGPL